MGSEMCIRDSYAFRARYVARAHRTCTHEQWASTCAPCTPCLTKRASRLLTALHRCRRSSTTRCVDRRSAAAADRQWNDVWTWPLRNLVFAACLTYFLGTGGLLSKDDAARVLGSTYSKRERRRSHVQWTNFRATG